MTTLRRVSDFVYFLPFLFSLYHHPEPSGTFYDNPHTTAMMNAPDHSSMTQDDVVTSMTFWDFLHDSLVMTVFTIGCTVSSISIAQQLYFTLSLVFIYFLTIPDSSPPLSSLSFALSSEPLIIVPLKPLFSQHHRLAHVECSGAIKLLTPKFRMTSGSGD